MKEKFISIQAYIVFYQTSERASEADRHKKLLIKCTKTKHKIC